MSAGVQITDNATGELRQLIDQCQVERVRPVVGRAAVNRVQSHLFDYNETHPNRLGGTRTNFYADAARSTAYTILVDGVLVSITQVGFRQRYEGGTIRARDRQLTIPVAPEAHGKRAREFSNLEFGFGIDPRTGRPRPALIEAQSTDLNLVGRGRNRRYEAAQDRGGKVMYWLAWKVTQRGDRGVLPTEQQIIDVCISAIRAHLRLNNS